MELRNEFEENGLEIVEVFADVKGTPYDNVSDIMAVVARKKGIAL